MTRIAPLGGKSHLLAAGLTSQTRGKEVPQTFCLLCELWAAGESELIVDLLNLTRLNGVNVFSRDFLGVSLAGLKTQNSTVKEQKMMGEQKRKSLEKDREPNG